MKYVSTIDGWMRPEELQFLHDRAKEMKSVLEIGSWKGRSTHALLSACKGPVVAVDHFKGSESESWAHQEAKQDNDAVYNQFMQNVGHFKNLSVLRMSSKEAKEKVGDKKYEMIFIDGEHTYESVKEDILLWKDNASVLLCGHDYTPLWPGVIRAVDEVLGRPDGIASSIWYKWMSSPSLEVKKGASEAFKGDKGNKSSFIDNLVSEAKIEGKNILIIKDKNLVVFNDKEIAVDCSQSGLLFNLIQSIGFNFDLIIDQTLLDVDKKIIPSIVLLPYLSENGSYFVQNVINFSKMADHLNRFGYSVEKINPESDSGDCDVMLFGKKKTRIPKKIFTIWLNDNKKFLEINERCIKSQKLAGYEHKVITLDNCFKDHIYIQQCLNSPFSNKKYIKMSDFLRLHYLYTEGGIYLDADVEVLPGKSYDKLLDAGLFAGKEFTGYIGSSTIGSPQGHPLILRILDRMVGEFRGDDDKVFESGMGLFCDECYKWPGADINILSQEYFFPFCHEKGSVDITDKTISYHHFQKSWVGDSTLEK